MGGAASSIKKPASSTSSSTTSTTDISNDEKERENFKNKILSSGPSSSTSSALKGSTHILPPILTDPLDTTDNHNKNHSNSTSSPDQRKLHSRPNPSSAVNSYDMKALTKQQNQIEWDLNKELVHEITRPSITPPGKKNISSAFNSSITTPSLSSSVSSSSTPSLPSSSSVFSTNSTNIVPVPSGSRPSTQGGGVGGVMKPSGPPSRPRGPPPGVPVKPFPVARSDTDLDLLANFSDSSEPPIRPTSPANVPPLNFSKLQPLSSGNSSNNSSTNSINLNSSLNNLKSSITHLSTNSSVSTNNSSSSSSITTTGSSSTSSSNLPHVVKETQLIKRNRAHIPTNLNHAQPTGGDWLKKRYIVNNYILLDLLGTGSYGEVKLCKDRRNENLFAIKIINKDFLKKKKFKNLSANNNANNNIEQEGNVSGAPGAISHPSSSSSANPISAGSSPSPAPASSDEENFFEDIRREIAIMKKLNHPNILRLYEVLDDPKVNKLYLVLEYVKKGDLLNVLKKDAANTSDSSSDSSFLSLSESDLWNLFRQLVSGIRYLHHQGICHGDIKPQNLLISEDGVLKIADFGISQMLDSSQGEKQDGSQNADLVVVAGTPAFMAPELCMAQQQRSNMKVAGVPSAPIKINGFKADIWAIGATMFMLRVGRPPFISRSVIKLYEKIVNDPVEFPDNPPMPPGFQNLLSHLLEKNVDDRYSFDQIMKHLWYATPKFPTEDSILSNKQPQSRVSTASGVRPTNVARFQPPSSYDREEAAAMDRPIQTVDKNEVFMSIGGINQQKKKREEIEEEEEEEGEEEDLIPLEEDTSFDRVAKEKNKESEKENLMDTRWGEDVFEIVEEDLDDDDDDDDDIDEDDTTKSEISLKIKKKSSKNVLKQKELNSVSSVSSTSSFSRLEMTQEEQLRRSKQFLLKARRSTENMDTIKELEVSSSGTTSVSTSSSSSSSVSTPPSSKFPISKNKSPEIPPKPLKSKEKEKKQEKKVDKKKGEDKIKESSKDDEDEDDKEDESDSEEDILASNPLTHEEFATMMDTLNMQYERKERQTSIITSNPSTSSSPPTNVSFPPFSSIKSLEMNEKTKVCLSFSTERGCRSYQEDRGYVISSLFSYLNSEKNDNLILKNKNFNDNLLKELKNNIELKNYFSNLSLVFIFDGHSGWRTSNFLKDNFLIYLLKNQFFYFNKINKLNFFNLLNYDEDLYSSVTLLKNDLTSLTSATGSPSEKVNKKKELDICLQETFILSDYHACQMLRENNEDPSGSTGIIVLYDKIQSQLTCAWIGDSQCVLSMSGKASLLNPAHRLLGNEEERARIKMHGGVVINNRVNGVLAVSRAFGDLQFKTYRDNTGEFQTPTDYYLQGEGKPPGENHEEFKTHPSFSSSSLLSTSSSSPVYKTFSEIYAEFSSCILTSLPSIVHARVTPGTEFAIIATDGLWDAMSYQRAVTFVKQKIHVFDGDLDQVSKALCQEAIARGSVDNVTAVIVTFH